MILEKKQKKSIFSLNNLTIEQIVGLNKFPSHKFKENSMKKNLFLFLLMCFYINVNGQAPGQYLSVISSQATPVQGGVNVNLQTFCSELMYHMEYNYTIVGNQINLSSCYYITPLLLETSLNENFFIPTPNSDNYVVNLTIYTSQSSETCDYSTVQDYRTLTLSNDDFALANDDLKLFPNPNDGVFQIQSENQTIDTIRLYNSLGNLVHLSTSLTNDVSNLEEGIYFVVITTENGNTTKKMALQK